MNYEEKAKEMTKMLEEMKFRMEVSNFIEYFTSAKMYGIDIDTFFGMEKEEEQLDLILKGFIDSNYLYRDKGMYFVYNKETNNYEFDTFKLVPKEIKQFDSLSAAQEYFKEIVQKDRNAFINETKASDGEWYVVEFEEVKEIQSISLPSEELDSAIMKEFEDESNTEMITSVLTAIKLIMDKERIDKAKEMMKKMN